MTFCKEMHCSENPSKCPYAIEKEDGDSYFSGLPIRVYYAGEDCPKQKEKSDAT